MKVSQASLWQTGARSSIQHGHASTCMRNPLLLMHESIMPAEFCCIILHELAIVPAALLGVLAATMVKFHEVSPGAAYALGPYFLWSSYATALTASIYRRAGTSLVHNHTCFLISACMNHTLHMHCAMPIHGLM